MRAIEKDYGDALHKGGEDEENTMHRHSKRKGKRNSKRRGRRKGSR